MCRCVWWREQDKGSCLQQGRKVGMWWKEGHLQVGCSSTKNISGEGGVEGLGDLGLYQEVESPVNAVGVRRGIPSGRLLSVKQGR